MKKLITLLLCAVMLSGTAFGLTASAAEFDSFRHGNITLHYTDDGAGFEDLEIAAYRVADIYSNVSFGLAAPFSALPINVNNVKTQAEWKSLAGTVAAYIIAEEMMPYCMYGTDENGAVVMDNMETGLYLILGVNAEKDGTVYAFENFFVMLPSQGSGGWDYDVEAVPKKDKYNGYLEYRVTKLWQDAQNPSARPQSVAIDIYCDGIYVETQTLNTENGWTYCWQDDDGKGVWTVAENNVPANYTVTVNQNENTFSVINKYEKPTPTPEPTDKPDKPDKKDDTPGKVPDTGDISSNRIYFIAMCVSGLVLIIIGIILSRKKRNE